MDKQTFVALSRAKYGNQFSYDRLPEKIRRSRESFTCSKHGVVKMIPRDHLRTKYGCPKCANDQVTFTPREHNTRYIERAKKKFNGKFDYSRVNLDAKPKEKVIVVCPEHGENKVRIRGHYHSDHGCKECAKTHVTNAHVKYGDLEAVTVKAKTLFGDRYTYSDFDKETGMVTIHCPDHGPSRKYIHSLLSPRGCRLCGLLNFTTTVDEFLERAMEVHPEGYTYYVGELRTVNDRITIKHKCGKIYRGRVSNHLSGQGCNRCKGSLGEAKILEFLDHNDIRHVEQFRVPGHRYAYDFHLPDLNIVIEYDGQQHFRPVEFFGGEEAFRETVRRDADKNRLAKELGLHMVRIPYHKFDQIEAVLSRAIDSRFNYRVNSKFYASFRTFCTSLQLPGTTTPQDVEKYRTLNVLSPPSQK